MKYIFFFFTLLIVNVSCGTIAQEQYRSHTVSNGETVYSISKKYGISEAEIYSLNPDAQSGVRSGSVLILPNEATISQSEKTPSQFLMHRVKRKETLYSIALKYNVAQDDIMKFNKDLYSRLIKKGEKIRIPIYGGSTSNEEVSIIDNGSTTENTEDNTHIVQAKETKFGIARKYGISIAELEDLNPDLPENLPIGTRLKVPTKSVLSSATIDDDNYDFYEVQPKEGFFRLKIKLGLTEEEIATLNPYAKDGLKEGMILKIPKSGNSEMSESVGTVDLLTRIVNRKKKKIALMLPFQLQKVDKDSMQANEKLLKRSNTIRVALDFYSGALMAAEFAKENGISVELDVYDTQASASQVEAILSKNNFDDLDAVVGPLLSSNVEKVAERLKSDGIPVFSPLSNKEIKLYANLFQTLPSDERLEESMINYLKDNGQGKNIVIICDPSRNTQKQALLSAFPNAKTISLRKDAFLYVGDISKVTDKSVENWFILESPNPVAVSNVVGLLNGLPSSYMPRLFTLDKNDAYDYHDVSNIHLAKLQFTFPSVNKSYNYKEKNPFLVSYKNKYGVLPNKYVVRGFDVMYDVLLRLASADDMYDASTGDFETEYIENKFHYTKKMFSGYQNQAMYIVKYNNELQFEIVK